MASSNLLNQTISLKLNQRLDENTIGWLADQVEQLKQSDFPMWVFDMDQVEFVDSHGLVGLLSARKAAVEADAQLVLCGVRKSVHMVLDLAQVDHVFAMVESMEALPVLMTNRLAIDAAVMRKVA